MGTNSNVRNGAIHNARKHAYSRPRPSQQQGTTATRNDKKEFFDYNGTTYLKASDMYRADEDGNCQTCVKGSKIYVCLHDTTRRNKRKIRKFTSKRFFPLSL